MQSENIFCWVDIPVLDLDRAIDFYATILAKPVQKIAEHGFEFGLLPHTEDSASGCYTVSGCLSVMDDRKPSQNGPLVYVHVEGRIDEAAELAKQHGGTVLAPKMQIGPWGHRAIILDTEGNAIALYSKEA